MNLNARLAAALLLSFAAACAHVPKSPASVPPSDSVAKSVPDKTLRVTFADVKQGDAILIQLGDVDLLVDAGVAGGCDNLRNVLKSVSGSIEILFISHPHDDHFGCAAKEVFPKYEVKRVITNGERRGPPRDSETKERWDTFVAAAEEHGLELEWLTAGMKLKPAKSLTITVLASGNPTGGEYPDTSQGKDINNDSLVMMLEFAGRKLLLTGDIQEEAGRMLVERYCRDHACEALKADVLKVPHHGSAHFDEAFFERVNPEFAVVSASYRSTKDHLPRAQPLRALQELGAHIYSTSSDGTEDVVLEIDGADGVMTWTAPSSPVFAWEDDGGPEVSFAQ